MNSIELDQARERLEREIADAARARLLDPGPSSIRRAIGRSIIRIGERLAAEPSLRPSTGRFP